MKLLEKILAIGILIGLILKFFLVYEGEILIFLSIIMLSIIYFPLGFLFFNQIRLRQIARQSSFTNVTPLWMIFSSITGIGLATVCIGCVYKLLPLQGGDPMLTVGLPIISVVLVIALILALRKKDEKARFILRRVIIIGIIGVALFLTTEADIIKLQYRNHPAYSQAYIRFLADPEDPELLKKKQLEYNRIILSEKDFKLYEKSLNR